MTDPRQSARDSATSARSKVFYPRPIHTGPTYVPTWEDRLFGVVLFFAMCGLVGYALGAIVVVALR